MAPYVLGLLDAVVMEGGTAAGSGKLYLEAGAAGVFSKTYDFVRVSRQKQGHQLAPGSSSQR